MRSPADADSPVALAAAVPIRRGRACRGLSNERDTLSSVPRYAYVARVMPIGRKIESCMNVAKGRPVTSSKTAWRIRYPPPEYRNSLPGACPTAIATAESRDARGWRSVSASEGTESPGR